VALSSKILIQSLFISVVVTALIAYAGSGALITEAMSAMGVSPWKFTLALSGELIAGALLALYLPRIGRR
jgi:predicted benzoate:H+ symporter BenE